MGCRRATDAPGSVHLSGRAVRRMRLRRISRTDVALVLASREREIDHVHGTTNHLGRALDGRSIVVATETDDHVITVMLEDEG